MKNNKILKTILVLAAMLIVCSLAVPAFAETGTKPAEETIGAAADKDKIAETADDEADAAAEAAGTGGASKDNEEGPADSEAEETRKHHKSRKPAVPRSGSETEEKPAEGRNRDKNHRFGEKNRAEGTAEGDKTGPSKKHSFGKDRDDDDDDRDDDDKGHKSKKSFGRGKKELSAQRPERSEGSSGKSRKCDCDPHKDHSTKRPFTSASEKSADDEKSTNDAQDESETVVNGSAASETVSETVPETETEIPDEETVKDEA